MAKISKTEKIRQGLAAGRDVKEIAKTLKIKPAYVYSVRWHLKQKKGAKASKQEAKQRTDLKAVLDTLTNAPVDPISPEHYQIGGIETHEFIEAKGLSYNVGTAVAYLSRAYYKGEYLQDIKKAAKHLEFEIARIENPRKAA